MSEVEVLGTLDITDEIIPDFTCKLYESFFMNSVHRWHLHVVYQFYVTYHLSWFANHY